MQAFTIVLIVVAAVAALLIVIGLLAMFFIFFFSPKFDRENPKPDVLMGPELPRFIKETDKELARIKSIYSGETVAVRSDDGLNLTGVFYLNPDKTDRTVLCVHGYNSCGHNDFALMIDPILKNGYNCLLIDQRHYGNSEGRFTGFGMPESRDLLKWTALVNECFPDGKIVLYGISMGAATVMQASRLALPPSVVGIVEDCGFTSAREEFAAVLKNIAHLPSFPALNVLTGLSRLFLHGDADNFIPVSMCGACCEACSSEKQMHIYRGAGHAQSHFRYPEEYERDFFAFVQAVTASPAKQGKE